MHHFFPEPPCDFQKSPGRVDAAGSGLRPLPAPVDSRTLPSYQWKSYALVLADTDSETEPEYP